MSKAKLMLLVFAICLSSVYSDAIADQVNYSAAHYFAAGLLMVDIGASVANGIALTTHRPNQLNGYLGVVTGSVTLVLVGVTYALTDDKNLRDSFALAFGTAGTVSLVLGAATVLRSSAAPRGESGISGVRFFPCLTMENGQRYGMGVGAHITF